MVGESVVVSAGDDLLVKVWTRDPNRPNGLEGTSPINLVGHSDRVQTVCLSPDGRYAASAGLDRNIRFWDLHSGEEIAVIRQHSSHVRHISFDKTGQYFFSSGDDNRINAWKVQSLTKPVPRGQWVAFSNTSRNLISAGRSMLEIWSAPETDPIVRLTEHASTVNGVVSSTSKNIVAILYINGSIVLCNAENGKTIRKFEPIGKAALCAAFSKDGNRLYVGYQGGKINEWNLLTGELNDSVKSINSVYRLELSNDGKKLLTGHTNGALRIWLAKDFTKLQDIKAHEGALLDIATHPVRDEIATTGTSGEIRIWDIRTGNLLLEMQVGASWLNCMCYTPDGNRLVSGSEHTITFWNTTTGKEVLSFSANRCVHSMAFSSDGKYFAVTGEDPRVRLWQGKSLR